MLSGHFIIILTGLFLVSSILGQKCPFIECPPGWRMWRRGCYNFTLDLSWADAKGSCLEMGGELVSPRSQLENEFIVGYVAEKYTDWFDIWIACDDLDVEGEWMCNNMQQTNIFMYWLEGEPNHDGDCALISKYYDKKWLDVPCTREHPAICYRKAKALSSVRN